MKVCPHEDALKHRAGLIRRSTAVLDCLDRISLQSFGRPTKAVVSEVISERGRHGERGARAYTGGLGAEPPVGSRGTSSVSSLVPTPVEESSARPSAL